MYLPATKTTTFFAATMSTETPAPSTSSAATDEPPHRYLAIRYIVLLILLSSVSMLIRQKKQFFEQIRRVAISKLGAKAELSSSSTHRCSDEWGEFLKGLLTQTKINLQPSLWNYETCYFMSNVYASGTLCHRDSWTKHNSCLIIHPPSKFAFCEIAKNGCSQWTTVLAKLFYDNINIKFSHFDLSLRSFEKYGIEGLNSIFSDPPMLRRLS